MHLSVLQLPYTWLHFAPVSPSRPRRPAVQQHMKSSQLPFICQRSTSSYLLRENTQHLPRCRFNAVLATGISSHLCPFASWDCQHFGVVGRFVSPLCRGVLVSALEAAQLDTAHCMSYLIGARWICLLGSFRGNWWCLLAVESTFLTTHTQNILQIAI